MLPTIAPVPSGSKGQARYRQRPCHGLHASSLQNIIRQDASPQPTSCLLLHNAGVDGKTRTPARGILVLVLSLLSLLFLCFSYHPTCFLHLRSFLVHTCPYNPVSFLVLQPIFPFSLCASFSFLLVRLHYCRSLHTFLYYKMPRAPKPTTRQQRSTPYSVTTSTTLAPSPMASHLPSPHTSASDRHAAQSWTSENDELLMRARQQGLNWQPIALKYFPDKTANACRKRHERLMEKRNSADNWDGVKLDLLSKAYIELREQMWKILADRVGEKWQNVEAKVSHRTCHSAYIQRLIILLVYGERPQNPPDSKPHSLTARSSRKP